MSEQVSEQVYLCVCRGYFPPLFLLLPDWYNHLLGDTVLSTCHGHYQGGSGGWYAERADSHAPSKGLAPLPPKGPEAPQLTFFITG